MVTAPPKPEEISHETIAFIEGVREFYEAQAARDELIEKTSKWVSAINNVLAQTERLSWRRRINGDWRLILSGGVNRGAAAGAHTQLGCLLAVARQWNLFQED